MPLRVVIDRQANAVRLSTIPNGTFFNGQINGMETCGGPFLKVGSHGEAAWVVVRLRNMEGIVWVSKRDDAASVVNYVRLPVSELVLREASSADAVDPVGGGSTS